MHPRADIGVVIVAAGSGTRLGRDRPKAFVPVGAATILEHCLHSVFGMQRPAQIVVVVPESERADAEALVTRAAGIVADTVSVVVGGATRQGSVLAGLAALGPAVSVVLVHDAARAFTPPALFDAVIAAVERTAAGVIPALPVTDTIKQTDAQGAVVATVDRSTLAAVQTPQGFPRAELESAYARADREYTDDAAVFAAAGLRVGTVPGDVLAFKITTPWDLRRAESIVAERGASTSVPPFRTGIGIDVHAFDPEAPLWLGGLHWPGEPGLAGHSDGDALSHAVCDALLSASGLGDIGSRFGTDDARYAGAHGDVFLEATVALLADAGWSIGNVAVQVVARRPRMSGRRDELEGHLTSLVGAPVSVSATTTDGLGFTGRTEGVAVMATALVHRAGDAPVVRLDR